MNERKETCQSCSHNRIEHLTPIRKDDDGPSIHGIDYQYRCKIHDVIVKWDYWCTDFELPF